VAERVDRPNVVIPPPIAWALAIVAGLGAGWLYPLHFVPTSMPRAWVGGGVFALGLALAIWAMVTPFYLVIRRGVVAREETYLERKFGAVYLGYKSRVRRWL